MKICLISNSFNPCSSNPARKVGGAEVCVERIAAELGKKGHSVIVITHGPFSGFRSLFPKKIAYPEFDVYSFYPLNLFSIYNAWKKPFILKAIWRIVDLVNITPAIIVGKIIKQEAPDIINAHIIHGFSPLALIAILKKTGRPLIQTVHSWGFICPKCNMLKTNGQTCLKQRMLCRLFRLLSLLYISEKPNAVIFPSQFCQQLYLSCGLFKSPRKKVIYNPVEIGATNPHKSSVDTFTVLFAGRLIESKGVHLLIEAFKTIPDSDCKLLIAGEGPEEIRLRVLAKDDPRINFLGKLSWQHLRNLYTKSNIVVLPTINYEIFGNVIIESMSCGTPVIGSRIGGIPEIIDDKITGLLVPPKDSQALKNTLCWCIDHPEELKEIGERAFNKSRDYDLKEHVSELEGLYQQVLSEAFCYFLLLIMPLKLLVSFN